MIALLFLGLTMSSSPGPDPEDVAGLQLRAWIASAEGEFQGDSGSLEGTSIDLDEDLGLGGPETLLELSGYVRLGNLGRVWAGYWGGSYEGEETLTRTIRFRGRTYTVSTTVESDVRLGVGSLTYEAPISSWAGLESEAVEFGLLIGGRGAWLDLDVQSSVQSASEAYGALFPVLGARASFRPWPWLHGELEGALTAVSYAGVSVRYAEAQVELRASFWGPFSAGVGYRFVSADVADKDDFEADFNLKGGYLVLALSF